MNLIRKRLQIIAFTLLLSVITVIGANVISDSNNKVASTEVKAATTIPTYELKYINSFSLNITIINISCQIIEKINIISKKCRRLDDKMLKYNYIKLIKGNWKCMKKGELYAIIKIMFSNKKIFVCNGYYNNSLINNTNSKD